MVLLQKAVGDIEGLRQIQTTAHQCATSAGQKPTFESYLSSLESAAVTYDHNWQQKQPPSYKAQQHDTRQVHASIQLPPTLCDVSEKSKHLWEQLSDPMRRRILQAGKATDANPTQLPKLDVPHPTSVNTASTQRSSNLNKSGDKDTTNPVPPKPGRKSPDPKQLPGPTPIDPTIPGSPMRLMSSSHGHAPNEPQKVPSGSVIEFNGQPFTAN